MTDLSKEGRAALQAICDAATEGPWESKKSGTGGQIRPYVVGPDGSAVYSCRGVEPGYGFRTPETWDRQQDNADFGAVARTALPACLDRIDALTDQLERFSELALKHRHELEGERDAALKKAEAQEAEVERLRDALQPFANFADPRGKMPGDLAITHGSLIAKRQLVMDDCYRARKALSKEQGAEGCIDTMTAGTLAPQGTSRPAG